MFSGVVTLSRFGFQSPLASNARKHRRSRQLRNLSPRPSQCEVSLDDTPKARSRRASHVSLIGLPLFASGHGRSLMAHNVSTSDFENIRSARFRRTPAECPPATSCRCLARRRRPWPVSLANASAARCGQSPPAISAMAKSGRQLSARRLNAPDGNAGSHASSRALLSAQNRASFRQSSVSRSTRRESKRSRNSPGFARSSRMTIDRS